MQTIDWSALHHAYGPAGDIPGLLEQLRRARPPRDYRDEPWFSLWSALYHQGDVFTASYGAVPWLVAIAEERHREQRVATECLYMAAMIELERGAHDGPTAPPPVPDQLAAEYQRAIERGARLTNGGLESDPEAREILDICKAAFAGDFPRARFLADGPAEEAPD